MGLPAHECTSLTSKPIDSLRERLPLTASIIIFQNPKTHLRTPFNFVLDRAHTDLTSSYTLRAQAGLIVALNRQQTHLYPIDMPQSRFYLFLSDTTEAESLEATFIRIPCVEPGYESLLLKLDKAHRRRIMHPIITDYYNTANLLSFADWQQSPTIKYRVFWTHLRDAALDRYDVSGIPHHQKCKDNRVVGDMLVAVL